MRLVLRAIVAVCVVLSSWVGSVGAGHQGRHSAEAADVHKLIFLPGLRTDAGNTCLAADNTCDGGMSRVDYSFGRLTETGLAGLGYQASDVLRYSYSAQWRAGSTYTSEETQQPLEVSARVLEEQLQEWVRQYPTARFDLIGHSLGGAVAALWAGGYSTPATRAAVASVVSLDSPVGGIDRGIASLARAYFCACPVIDSLSNPTVIEQLLAGSRSSNSVVVWNTDDSFHPWMAPRPEQMAGAWLYEDTSHGCVEADQGGPLPCHGTVLLSQRTIELLRFTLTHNGERWDSFSPTFLWTPPADFAGTEYQFVLTPANNDAPGVDLRLSFDTTRFTVPAPPNWYGLLPDMTYSWSVVALSNQGATSSMVRPVRAGQFHTPPVSSATLSPLPAVAAPGREAVVRWANADPRVFYYEVQVSTDPAFGGNSPVAAVWWNLVHGGVTANSWQTPPLEPNRTYYWRVRPRIQGDGRPVEWSVAWTFRTSPTGGIAQ